MEKNNSITKQYKNTKQKGDIYENYILEYLYESIPKCNAWLWSNIPEEVMCDVGLIGNWNEHRKQRKANRINKLPDIGCDIFMITPNNENHLVQCKYYASKNHVKFEDIAGWSLMLVDNQEMYGDLYYTSKLSENLKARKPNPRISYIHKPYDEQVISESKIETTKPSSNTISKSSYKSITKPTEKPIITLEYALNTLLEVEVIQDNIKTFNTLTLKPFDYQLTAYNALKDKQRTVLQLPCGMGKTLIAIMLASHYDLIVFISPLKAFCEQNMARFNEQLQEYNCNIIDSDGTRDINQLQTILADDTCKHALFVTYKSLDVIMKLYDMKLLNNGYFIIDEFHNIPYEDAYNFDSEDEDYLDDDIESMKDDDISVEDEENEKHSDTEIESDSLCDGDEDYLEEDDSENIEKVRTPMYRLLHSTARIMFMSATPRLFEESDETADGMDIDSELFGEIDYSFPMGKAIEEGYICDYFVYVPTMAIKQDTGIEDVITELQVKDYNREILVKSRFILRGCLGTGSRKCIIYCIEQEECNIMMNIIKDLCENYLAIDCWCDTITSNDTPEKRKKKLKSFKDTKEIAFVCSVNILNECIDIPECDSIFITYASKSKIRNIQRLCRANRKDKKNPNKIASVFLWCDEYNQTAEFMKHVKEYDSRFTYERVKRVCSSDVENSGVMKAGDSEKDKKDKKDLDNVIIGYKGVSSWYEMLEKVKKFIDEHGKRPTRKDDKNLQEWLVHQLEYFEKMVGLMKINIIYDAFKNFINHDKYNKYFMIYYQRVKDWNLKLKDFTDFIDINKRLPKPKKANETERKLCKWFQHNTTDYKNIRNSLKKNENRIQWMIMLDKYKEYFLSRYEKWMINFNNLQNYVNQNKSLPKDKILNKWHSHMSDNFLKKNDIMSEDMYYNLWKNFRENNLYLYETWEDTWNSNYKKAYEYLKKHDKYPKVRTIDNDEKIVANWLSNQNINFKKNQKAMKYENYRNKYIELVKEFNHLFKYFKKYIDDNDYYSKENKLKLWIKNLDKVKQYIDLNNKRPFSKSHNNIKILQNWIGTQNTNANKRRYLLKDNTIYTLWNNFILDPKYSKYF
jgi:superfamily II DNA or RNA helicase